MAHVQGAAIADEAQTLKVLSTVHPEISRRATRFGNQAFFFVIAHGFDRALSKSSQFTDFHESIPKSN